MAKSNAAEAMPMGEASKEEEIELTEADLLDVEEISNESEKPHLPGVTETEDQQMTREAKEKTELHKKKAREATKRKKDMSQLRGKLADIKNKREASTAEIRDMLPKNLTERQKAEEAKESEERLADLKEMGGATIAATEAAKNAPIKLGKEDVTEIADDPLAGSAEDRMGFANMLKIPHFDHLAYNDLVMQKEREDKNMAAIESGEVKVGWFRKRRMKKRLKQILKELKPLEDEVVSEVLAKQGREGGYGEPRPADPVVGIEKPMEHGLIEDMDYHAKIEASNKLQKEIDKAEKSNLRDTPEIKKKREEMKKLLEAIDADEERLGKKKSKNKRKKRKK